MAERELIKKYKNGDLTVIWKPKVCIHAKICVKTLPEVYNPNEKPWIKAENASIEALKAQISKCPSGALSYEVLGENEVAGGNFGNQSKRNAQWPLINSWRVGNYGDRRINRKENQHYRLL